MRRIVDTPFLSESGTASGLVEFASHSGAREPEPRFLKAKTWLLDKPDWIEPALRQPPRPSEIRPASVFREERWHVLTISVAPLAVGETPELPPLDLHDIVWTEDEQPLKVVITAPGCDVLAIPRHLPPQAASDRSLLSGLLFDQWRPDPSRLRPDGERERPGGTGAVDITITSTGSSTVAAFLLKPRRSSPVKARILVLHANRILQTAILEGAVHNAEAEPGEESRGISVPRGRHSVRPGGSKRAARLRSGFPSRTTLDRHAADYRRERRKGDPARFRRNQERCDTHRQSAHRNRCIACRFHTGQFAGLERTAGQSGTRRGPDPACSGRCRPRTYNRLGPGPPAGRSREA